MPDHKPGIVGPNKTLNDYWTKGPGLTKWAGSSHPYTTLVNLLTKYMTRHVAKGLAASYFRMVFGIWPGERFGKNPRGPG